MNVQEQKTDWTKVAAWTFGAWAVLVPLSAGFVVRSLDQKTKAEERTQADIAELRSETMKELSDIGQRQAVFNTNQVNVMHRLDNLEARHLRRE